MKMLSNLFQILSIVFLSTNFLVGQADLADLSMSASVDFENDKLVSYIKRETKKETIISKDIYFDINEVDNSTSINVASNELDFSGLHNRRFSALQLILKKSNKSVVSRKIDNDYTIDLNTLNPGSYIFILSNDKGELKTEEIIII
jgi:hypothetical protein